MMFTSFSCISFSSLICFLICFWMTSFCFVDSSLTACAHDLASFIFSFSSFYLITMSVNVVWTCSIFFVVYDLVIFSICFLLLLSLCSKFVFQSLFESDYFLRTNPSKYIGKSVLTIWMLFYEWQVDINVIKILILLAYW